MKFRISILTSSAAALVIALAPMAPAAAQQTPEAHMAQVQADMTVARRYFELMVSGDTAAQADMLAEDAVFEDPMVTLTGRDAIRAAWNDQQIRFLGFDETAAYHSRRGVVVISGMTRFEQTFRTPTGEPLPLTFETRTTTALTVSDGRIVRHIDYVDTGAFAEQLMAHIRRLQGE